MIGISISDTVVTTFNVESSMLGREASISTQHSSYSEGCSFPRRQSLRRDLSSFKTQSDAGDSGVGDTFCAESWGLLSMKNDDGRMRRKSGRRVGRQAANM